MKNIRKAQIEDYEIIDNFIEELHGMHVKARPDMYRPAEHVYTMSEYKQILNSDDKEVLVYEEAGRVVAACFITFRISTKNPVMVETPILYVEDIFVDKEFRKKGIGAELYKYVRKLAQERKCQRIELMVWEFNQDAIQFYKKMGMNVQRSFFEENVENN